MTALEDLNMCSPFLNFAYQGSFRLPLGTDRFAGTWVPGCKTGKI
jgi:hypothetical protein